MKNIVESAADAGEFKTLIAAVKAAGLTSKLSDTRPFTLFAPTDAAFKKLPAGTIAALLKDIPRLKSILMYHVAAGKLAARDIKSGDIGTLEGTPITASIDESHMTINGAKLTAADIGASNGVIHAIDSFLMPGSPKLAAVA